jgi:predicted ATPase/DNA-binding XRE family transcriptional regulator
MNTSAEVSFGEWLKRRRKALGLTQEQLAQQICCSTILLRKIEAEERRPSTQIIERLAEVFKVASPEREAFFRFARGDWRAAPPEVAEGVPRSIPRSGPRSRLPASTTSFIGREKELKEIAGLFSTSRLITLTGPGGVGKTRLALQIAREQQAAFDDGVWFIELASLAQPELVPSVIAAVMRLEEAPNQPVSETLAHFLKSKKLLLVLDNCEHVIEACARLSDDLLCACPQLQILATSRELLRTAGEWTWRVSSLALPDPQHLPPVEELKHSEAVRLLVERARALLPSFELTEHNAGALAQICFRLEGMPLALELAAALVNVLTIEQILAGLDDCFRLLMRGSRIALNRQQTLRATMDWSYNLLSEGERALFRRLAVFAGGWTLKAAEQVASYSPRSVAERDGEGQGAGDHATRPLPLATSDVLSFLTQLVNKSLVVVERDRGAAARYRLLETIRQYAWEKLGEIGEGEHVRHQHLNYFLKLAKEAEPQLTGPDQVAWLNQLDSELDNVRTALAWSLEKNVEAGLRLVSALDWFWVSRENVKEGCDWLAQLLTRPEALARTTARAKVLIALYLSGLLRSRQRARSLAEESLALYRELGDRPGEAFCLFVLSGVQDDLFSERLLAAESLARYRELGDKLGTAYALGALGLVTATSDVVRAQAYLEESLALCRELGHLAGMSISLGALGMLAIQHGDYSLARQRLEEAGAIGRRLGARRFAGHLWLRLHLRRLRQRHHG